MAARGRAVGRNAWSLIEKIRVGQERLALARNSERWVGTEGVEADVVVLFLVDDDGELLVRASAVLKSQKHRKPVP